MHVPSRIVSSFTSFKIASLTPGRDCGPHLLCPDELGRSDQKLPAPFLLRDFDEIGAAFAGPELALEFADV